MLPSEIRIKGNEIMRQFSAKVGKAFGYHPLFGIDIVEIDKWMTSREQYNHDLSMKDNVIAMFGEETCKLLQDLIALEMEHMSAESGER